MEPQKEYPAWFIQLLSILFIVLVLGGVILFLYWRLSAGDSCQEFEC